MVIYFFPIFTRLAYQNVFLNLGVAILLLVAVALYILDVVGTLWIWSPTNMPPSLLGSSPAFDFVWLCHLRDRDPTHDS